MRRAMVTMIGLALAGGVAPAHDQNPDKPPAGGVLGGPKVREDAGRATIVARGFDGQMRAPEGPPELAALDRLELDEGTRAAVQAALDERAAIVDGILAEHFELFLRVRGVLQAMRSGGERRLDADARETMGEFRRAIGALTARGTVREEIGRLLPEGAREQFEAMVREHDEAVAAQRREAVGEQTPGEVGEGAAEDRPGARARGQRGGRASKRAGERGGAFRSYLAEFRDSYDRVVGQRKEDFEAMVKKLGLTAEQEAKLRDAARRSLGESGPNATPEQRREVIEVFLESLPADERREVIAKARGVRDASRAP